MTGNARYELGLVLGTGGAGVVYEAWDRALQRTVALKRVPLGPNSDDWLREARVGARLGHPAFVTVHDAWRDAHHAHLVMERVEGRTFKDVIHDGPTDAPTACHWVAQAAEALHSAHCQGVVHGDIKPSNLMVEPGGRVRVLDVGIARLLDPMATMGTSPLGSAGGSGTLDYMAPEQLRGEAASVASDMHALGLVLHELLNGRPAYGELAGMALAYRKLHGTAVIAPPAAAVPPWLAHLLESLLAQRPEQRPQDMAQVAAALRDATAATLPRPTAGHGVDAASANAAPPQHRRRWIALGLGTAAAALALGLGIRANRSTMAAPEPPPTPWVADQLAQAEALLKRFDDPAALDKAESVLRDLLGRSPRHAAGAALLAMARCLRYTQSAASEELLADAGRWAQLALAEDGQLAWAHAAAGLHAAVAGDRAAAESAYRRALLLEPGNWQALLWLADLLVVAKRYADADAVVDKALATYPDERLFHDVLGELRHAQGDYPAAERAFRRSLSIEPTGNVATISLSDTLTRLGRNDEALGVLQQGLRLRPHHRLYMHLGNALFDRSRFAEAAQAYERGITALPAGQPDAWLQANLADALSRLPGREADARRGYQRALQGAEALARRYPANATYASRAGLYAARLDDSESARRWAETAIALAPGSPDVLYRAAIAAALAGRTAEARERLQQALARGQPRSSVAWEPALAGLADLSPSPTTPPTKEVTP